MRRMAKLRRMIPILFMALLITAGYLQYGRKAQVVSTFKTGFDNSCSYVIDVSANKLYLTNNEADQIFQEIFDSYANEKFHMMTIYIYRDRYAMKKGSPLVKGVYSSSDSLKYNSKDNPEVFNLEVKKFY